MKRRLELTDPTPYDLQSEIFHTRFMDDGERPETLRVIDEEGTEYRNLTLWVEDRCLFIKLRQQCD